MSKNFFQSEAGWGSISVSPTARVCALLLPFLGWLALSNGGRIAPTVDNEVYANWVIYHFDYMTKGIFPLWDPFRGWGWPDLTDTRFMGEFNPLYLIVPLLMMLHVPAYWAFNIFLIGFHWLGGLGFYLVVRALWEEEFPALLAYTMYMFSTLGVLLFVQWGVPLLIVPMIWFFFFLLRFLTVGDLESRTKYFWGLVFATSIIVITYLPFFFLVMLGAVVLATCLARPGWLVDILKKIVQFACACPFAFWPGVALVTVSCLPGLIWWLSTANGNIVLLNSRNGWGQVKGATILLRLIEHSSLATVGSWGEIFSDQDLVVENSSYTYVPAFLVGILSLGLFTRMDARQRIVFLTAFFIFIFALASVTPVHAFLYQHVFFVRMIRNLYFFGPFLLLLLTALGVKQIQLLMKARPQNAWQRGWYLLFILLVHAALMYVLFIQERVLWTSYATFLGSAVLFLAYTLGLFDRRRGWFLVGLMCLAMLQPAQLVAKYWSFWGTGTFKSWDMTKPPFSYIRPLRGQFPEMELGWGNTLKKKQDDSGFLKEGFYGTKYAAMLYLNVPAQDLEKYVSHKFVLYDKTAYMDGDKPDWALVGRSLSTLSSSALIHDRRALRLSSREMPEEAPQVLAGPSDMLTVVRFEPDRIQIKTDFPRAKFLVYNDSYYPGWTAFVNGKAVALYRTNVAFKGIWVDAGPQTVEFRFGTGPQHLLCWAFMALLGGLLAYVVSLFLKEKKCVPLSA